MRTALILLLAASVTGCSKGWSDDRGVTDGPLAPSHAIPADLSGGETLSSLPNNSLRVLIRPSFGRYSFYVSLHCLNQTSSPDASNAASCGPAVVRVHRVDISDRSAADAAFYLPVEEAGLFLGELDARLRRWTGKNDGGADGTSVDLERKRDGRVSSLSSNENADTGLDNPASQVRGDLLRILLAYGPAGFFPRSYDWDTRSKGDDDDVCNRPALALPLDRGFGSGNSDCDAMQRWHH